VKFAFVTHCHQPVGNLDPVVHAAFDTAYLPFLDVLSAVPDMRVGLHYSGSLLRWSQTNRPELIDQLAERSDQIEFLGGGMHEPIMSILPDAWRRRQIGMQSALIEELFGQRPTGIWLAERLWEPTLAWLLHDLELMYTLLDQALFEVGGADILRPAIVDHLGSSVRVFPVSRPLRDMLPATDVGEVIEWLSRVNDEHPDAVMVAADDGQKFGGWDRSHQRVYGEGWLREMFDALVAAPWIDIVHPGELVELTPRPAALGAGSYSQMNQWLTENETSAAVWPAPWKRFLYRYPEANVMYRKMLALASTPKLPDAAIEHVLAAQASDAYWHGAFGGIYLPHLRSGVHTNLIAARAEIDSGRRTRTWTDLRITDWDGDGTEEIHAELPDQSWVLHSGGALHYYDDKPSRWPVSDVMARHRERHHSDPSQFDGVARQWLADRIAPPDAGPTQLYHPHHGPERYELETAEATKGAVRVRMAGAFADGGTVIKTLVAREREIEVRYELEGAGPARFGPELPISVWAGSTRLRVDGGAWTDVVGLVAESGHRFRFEHADRGTQVVVTLRLPGAVFVAPITTSIRSDIGNEDIFQGVALWPHFLIAGTGTYTMTISIVDVLAPE